MSYKSKRKDGTYSLLCSKLDLAKENGLVEIDSDAKDELQRYILRQAKDKLGADSVFFLKPKEGPSVPLIYFKKMEFRDRQKIAELHKKVWNMAQSPLLFVILPDTILIYNAYKPPRRSHGKLDDTAGFIEELNIYIDAENEIQKIMKYHRSELVTGNYWQKHSKKFKKEKRVYQTLLDNLEFMRKKLIEKEDLSSEIVHSLLNRSIFLKYLEDRTDKQGHNIFPDKYFEKYLPQANCFSDLLTDRKATYKFFRDLNDKFNGDIFLFHSKEETVVTQEHLDLLKELLEGEKYLESGQMMLWPLYAFDIIPIELISNIYQQTFHFEIIEGNGETSGAYYTPHHLVTFLMDRVLPWDGKNSDLKILDPSCGSGIFLVESYRRLIARWMQANPGKHPSMSELTNILKTNIFGVDIDPRAIRISALSLYLTMCDYLEPRYIWEKVKFEPLVNNNLFVSDFFKKGAPFLNKKYDLIIGNPPWESQLSEHARLYLNDQSKTVGDNQICQAFLWRGGDLCKPNGKICMIVSSKSLLFNRSTLNRKFRKQFFSSFNVKTVINFSALRYILFSKAVGPGAAIIYSPNDIEDTQSIFYCSPKPSYSPQDDWLLLIEPPDIAYIPKNEAIDKDVFWKVAMWGTPRDFELIKKLSKLPTLGEICENKEWIHGEGFIIGNKRYEAPELFGKAYVAAEKIQRLIMDEGSLPINRATRFYRYAKTKGQIFKPPHLLIKQGLKVGVGFIAAVLKGDAVFTQSILGIHGKDNDLNQLAACCLIINTKIPLYYGMLTSSRWLVERDEFAKGEILNIPLPENILEMNISYESLKDFSKHLEVDKYLGEKYLNDFVKSWYDLNDSEQTLINDALEFTLDYFWKKNKSTTIKPVDEIMLKNYIDTFCEILNNSFECKNKVFVGTFYHGENPLQAVSVKLIDKSHKPIKKRYVSDENLKDVLDKLEKIVTKEESPSIYVRRDLRRYSGNTIFIVKRNQKRYWTKSSALRDADETYYDIMSLWRKGLNEGHEFSKITA